MNSFSSPPPYNIIKKNCSFIKKFKVTLISPSKIILFSIFFFLYNIVVCTKRMKIQLFWLFFKLSENSYAVLNTLYILVFKLPEIFPLLISLILKFLSIHTNDMNLKQNNFVNKIVYMTYTGSNWPKAALKLFSFSHRIRFIEQTLIRASQIDGYRYLPSVCGCDACIRCVVCIWTRIFLISREINALEHWEKNNISRADVTASALRDTVVCWFSKLQLKFCGNLCHLLETHALAYS